MKTNIIYIVFLIAIVNIAKSDKRLRFKVKNVTMWSDNTFINFTYMIDEKVPSADIIIKVLSEIEDLDYSIKGSAVVKNNKKQFGSINVSYNFCHLMSMINNSPILMLLYAHLKSFGYLADSCPIKKDTYYIRKIWPEDHSTQLKLPEVEFDFNIKAYAIQNASQILIMDLNMAAESIYVDVAGDKKKTGLFSLLNSGR